MKGDESDLKDVLAKRQSSAGSAAPEGPGWRSFDMLFHGNPQPMWSYERETLRFLDVNEAAIARYGYSREEFLDMALTDIRPSEDVGRLREITSGPRRTGYGVSEGWRHIAKDGELLHVNVHSQRLDYGETEAVLVVISDVTRIVETIGQLETQKVYFQQLFQNSPEGIVLLDTEGKILEANEGFQKMFGYGLDELIGKSPLSLIVPQDAVEDSLGSFHANVRNNESTRLSTMRQKKNGDLINVEVLAYPLQVNGVAQGVFAIYQDTTEKQRALREIEYQAHHDSLTGLANRARLAEALKNLWADDKSNPFHAFLYIDLDQFKVINDTCGHNVGDDALLKIAALLKSHVRDSDVVARLGGDEFGLLLPNCSEENALKKAEELLSAFRSFRFISNDQVFPVGASIGVIEISELAPSVETVMTAADAACYAAKNGGGDRIRLYRADDTDIILRRSEMSWLSRLREAIAEDHFVLFFQEIHSLSDSPDGVRHKEILIRYKDETGKLVPPGVFIPSAERYNLMPAIDRWVFKAVCEHLQRNRSRNTAREIISVNLSGTTLSDGTFPEFVMETLKATGVDPTSLCFEITETAAISNLTAARRLITVFKEMGCSISLDDFGSGMSSFNYLRTLPVDYLKIDGTFIEECHTNQTDLAMTEAINHVGKILGLKTVAEFVENETIYNKLKEIGVDYAQGYGLHVPEEWNN
ncbi:MAG: EAL domain-containing protein [Proteobacteria bacterium]|nr:EAL domain-containing protein [Pseudomonadota bacterium]